MNSNTTNNPSPWAWVPSLYFAEGIPYIVVMTLAVVFYKRMGISNTEIALYTSWLYLPWVIKPLWSPVVDMLKTKRWWIVSMQLLLGAGFAGVALMIPVSAFFQYTLAFFWLLAFSSATHDIAADGFYLLGLTGKQQAYFVGIRSTFYRLAMLTGQGLLVIVAGYLESASGLAPIRVTVEAQQQVASTALFQPDKHALVPESDVVCFLAPQSKQLATQNLSHQQANKIKTQVEAWNVKYGFYPQEIQLTKANNAHAGFWATYISKPIGKLVARHWGQEKKQIEADAGNIALIPIKLSHKPKPDDKVVLNLSHEKGDKSIQLAKTYRFEFTAANWDKPAYALVQLDPKLQRRATATFVGRSGNIAFAWSSVFFLLAVLFVVFSFVHKLMLPRPEANESIANQDAHKNTSFVLAFIKTYLAFFGKKKIALSILFLLVYRLAESQLVKMAAPFLLDARELGGLGITTGDLGFIYGTVGMLALTVGGILGGLAAAKHGLKFWIWWMAIAMNLPNVAYWLLSVYMPDSLWQIGAAVAFEQFGYGFGFTAYMLYMIHVAEGKHKTAHFAMTTAFMALGMMLPGMISGWLQEIIGYQHFFVWVLICTIPGFVFIPFLQVGTSVGKKE